MLPDGVALGDGSASSSLLRITLNDTTRQSPSTCWNTYWPVLRHADVVPVLAGPDGLEPRDGDHGVRHAPSDRTAPSPSACPSSEGSARTRHLRPSRRSASRPVPAPRRSPSSRTAPTRCRRSPRASCRDPGTRRCTARPSASSPRRPPPPRRLAAPVSSPRCGSRPVSPSSTSNANSGVGGFGLSPMPGMMPPASPPSNVKPSTTAATTTTPPTMRYAGLMREDEDACRPSDKTPGSVRAPSMSSNRTRVRNL